MKVIGSNGFHIKWIIGTHSAIEKMKILEALFELPSKQHCQSIQFTSKLGQIGQIGSAVLLVAPKGLPGFLFSQLLWVPIIHFMWNSLQLERPHFWVYYFSLRQCASPPGNGIIASPFLVSLSIVCRVCISNIDIATIPYTCFCLYIEWEMGEV